MYEKYWKLDRAPFDHDRRLEAFFPSRTHSESLVKLKYLIEHGKGSAALIGSSGTGKTHLLEMVRHASSQNPVIHLVYPQLSPYELIAFIANSLVQGMSGPVVPLQGLDVLLRIIETRLCELSASGNSPVIMLDDAHLIEDRRVFQALHQLMNFQRPGRSNFALILSGQPELAETLQSMDQMSDRIAFQCLVQSLTKDECPEYIRQRLLSVGRIEPIFDDSATTAIFELTSGIPRRINRLCDFALLVGYANRLQSVSAEQIEGVHSEITRPLAAA